MSNSLDEESAALLAGTFSYDETSLRQPLIDDNDSSSGTKLFYPEVSVMEEPVELAALTTRELHDLAFLQEVADLPQGRHLGIFAVTVNFISRILGSGIFAVPALIYKDVGGSPALFFLVWIISGVLAFAGLYVYMELGSLVAKNGGTKVFLEFVYYKPKMLTTVIVGFYSVLFGFVVSNSIVFGKYFLSSIGADVSSDSSAPGFVGLALVLVSFGIHSISVKGGTMIQNLLGTLKLILLVAIALSGVYVLLPESVTSIENQLAKVDFFLPKETVTVAGLTSLLFKGFFAMSGWNSVHTLAGEIADPIRTLKISGPLSLLIISVCYLFINLAYLIVIPNDELISSGELVGSLLLEKIFGVNLGRKLLTLSVALCAGGNVFVVMYSCARMNQEVFREGFLPFSRLFSSNKPFGTPFFPMLICVVITAAFLLTPTRGNMYNYIVNLESYPGQLSIALVALGVFIVRKRYPDIKAPIRSSPILTAFLIGFSCLILLGPLVPSNGSLNYDGYPNYAITTCAFLILCTCFWYLKFRLLPYLRHYELVQVEEVLDDGLTIKQWEKSYR